MDWNPELIEEVRKNRPLVHHITNVVTVNDCANITLSCGGAPVMADAPEEAADMTRLASALVLNIGTLNADQVETMIRAGKAANEKGIPVVLDPVGAGATTFRTETAKRLLDRIRICLLKGNAGEIATLAGGSAQVRGVDSERVEGEIRALAAKAAREWDVTVVVTGKRDLITDGSRWAEISNGHPLMGSITGTGCMGASVLAAFAAVSPDPTRAAVSALASYGVAAEQAAMQANGPASFRTALFDALAALKGETVRERARVDEGRL
ncbi:hydroxyethylthiazole kinase [Melghirimyces profundicolus]|uniref:Hydroxyethylthiazole kinase n=1 Tax=Melghirimyces profundicolus TaxID=1242148 RepID=A0A2T6BUA7_9BACL|nr:hydroxyethylthiazole kinase [Melghirimyces profundicolus]PTX59678.1 hydroxyethylthiazole kinase [Melghirimyces profundicolus]